jgi:hypothetical protein
MQRNRFDRAAKDILRVSLEPDGAFESDAEVSPDTQRTDVWFTPDPARPATRSDLGLLGRMTASACMLEPFHSTPGEDEVSECVRKVLGFRHTLASRKPAPPLPRMWIIASGRPNSALDGFAFVPVEGWPVGVYRAPRLLFAGLVVASELPRARDTLLLRLMGSGVCLREALADLAAMPAETRERAIAGPVLLRCRIEIAKEPAGRTSEDEEFMMNTEDAYETWMRETREEGLKQGLERGAAEAIAATLVMIYEIHFGSMPAEVRAVVEATGDRATLLSWVRLVETGTAEAFAAAVLAARAG